MPTQPELPRIKRLDEAVVNRIAAGEIIHRPANALKEMIENSLDAGATSIQITIKDGGLKLLQIQDNGHGISKPDLPLLCERFATSKLSTYEDLSSIQTYGFRGEALASISHVAHVGVVSKTEGEVCAWRAVYADGKLVPPKPGQNPDPKPCAGNRGTQIVVEDLFYNVPTRRRALKNPTEEYNRILDVVHKYAIHNSHVSFTCKKQGTNTADINTPTNATTLDNIRYVYGATIAKELLSIEHKDERWEFQMEGWVSNANYSMKKMAFLLFINHRSVDSANLKRALEAVYTEYLPRGMHPFVYLSMEIKAENVDVNVHPTKREVHFLNEDKIIETICLTLQQRLANANTSRTFYTQTFLPGATPLELGDVPYNKPTSGNAKKPEHKLVRTDSRTRSLDAFIVDVGEEMESKSKRIRVDEGGEDDVIIVDDEMDVDAGNVNDGMEMTQPIEETEPIPTESIPKRERVEVRLTSILELREEVIQRGHKGLTQILTTHTYVGPIDTALSLLQSGTKLYMVDHVSISQELFYQLGLQGFSNFGCIKLSTPACIFDLVCLAVEVEFSSSSIPDDTMSKEEIANQVKNVLIGHGDMLNEYFSVTITPSGCITTLPVLLKHYIPPLHKLPTFLLHLASNVVWTEEKPCFESFLRELAYFYALDCVQGNESFRKVVEHVVMPGLKNNAFVAPKEMVEDGSVVVLADLPDLYKVFERC